MNLTLVKSLPRTHPSSQMRVGKHSMPNLNRHQFAVRAFANGVHPSAPDSLVTRWSGQKVPFLVCVMSYSIQVLVVVEGWHFVGYIAALHYCVASHARVSASAVRRCGHWTAFAAAHWSRRRNAPGSRRSEVLRRSHRCTCDVAPARGVGRTHASERRIHATHYRGTFRSIS